MSVVKPQSTYTQDEYGQNIYILCFPIFKIAIEHVHNINAVILNDAYDLHEIVHSKKTALLHALDFFLRMPSEGFYSLKSHPTDTADVSKAYIKKLERLKRDLSSIARAQILEAEIEGHTDPTTQGQVLQDHKHRLHSHAPQPRQVHAEYMNFSMTYFSMAMHTALKQFASLDRTSIRIPAAQIWTKVVRSGRRRK
ncbi:hypothetical protein N0V91_006896 [Didymella pomorum]|uniref:Uncharacterized protein n=1 Tax=Didymella pomorum TaxID=749634 RepID=A0A9W8ZA01_9PLEO|nr:hypothetical protein N0V91_006896 [Didymella pomorum]